MISDNNESEKIITEESGNTVSENGDGNFAAVTSDIDRSTEGENSQIALNDNAGMMNGYKKACFKLGFFLTVALLIRIIAQGFAPAAAKVIKEISENTDVRYALQLLYSAVFLQIIPSFIAAATLNYSLKNLVGGFKPPKNSKKAFADFPVVYGAGIAVNVITLLITQLISEDGSIGNPVSNLLTSVPSMLSAVTLFFMTAIIAPIFEEFIFRGAVMNILKPYGTGIAVFVSAFSFAVFHGNFQQFFFALVIGILLGYISYATNSIFCTTILHAMFNSISGIIMIFTATPALNKKISDPAAVLSDAEQLIVTLYAIFMVIVLITALIGVVMMICKLIKIKKYRLPKVWGEVGNGKKMIILIFTLTMLLAVILTVDVMGFGYISDLISDAVRAHMSA